jgi:antitoxin (DNA-binding transcriptional repressor) of toxin-antitoxin stability system
MYLPCQTWTLPSCPVVRSLGVPVLSDNLIHVKDISATEAARSFSEVLDAVEHRHETFVVIRKGRSVARITPAVAASGRAVKDLLLAHHPDPTWGRELRTMRSKLLTEERDWNA